MAGAADIFSGVASGLVRGATFRTQITPSYYWDANAPAPPPQDGSSWLMEFLKPTVVVDTSAGPIEIAPYGRAENDYSLHALAALALLVVGGVVAIGWVARKL